MRRLLPLALLMLAVPASADDFKPEDGFTSLFNGKDFSGWAYKGDKASLDGKTETPDGRFAVEGGAIVARPKDTAGKGGIKAVETVKALKGPFTLRLEFKAGLKADSGVYIRGPQLQVRDFARRGEHKHLTGFKNDDWNALEVVVKDGVTTTTVNGKAIGDKDDFKATFKDGKVASALLNGKAIDAKNVKVSKGTVGVASCNGEWFETMVSVPASGPIGLQAESGPFAFRRVRVREDK